MKLVDRVDLMNKASEDTALQATLIELCSRDPVYWFNTFCWTYDPRKHESDIPFSLYPYQEWAVREIIKAIDEQVDLGIEKSRDMGLSYLVAYSMQWFWLFHGGSNFHIGSRRQDEVDRGYTDPGETIFGKLRYNLSLLPNWMKPKGFNMDKHSRLLSLENAELGNFITGESANASFGRGGRKRAVLMDELAFWECAEAAYGSVSQTTNCRIVVSTPYGESNTFYKLMHADDLELLEFNAKDQSSLASTP